MNKPLCLAIALLLLAACSKEQRTTIPAAPECEGGDELKINQLQVLGTHNSYSQGLEWLLAKGMGDRGEAIDGMLQGLSEEQAASIKEAHPNPGTLADWLNYVHAPLVNQLKGGLRTIELDLYIDPEGGRFLNPASRWITQEKGIPDFIMSSHDKTDLEKPGFKVLHVADIDYRSNCNLFTRCLERLKIWSDQNPNHVPIFIFLESKDKSFDIEGAAEITKFDKNYFDDMDSDIVNTIGRDKLITPDDVRGNYETLEAAVLANNWPNLKDSRGKFLFTLITVFNEDALNTYLDGHAGLAGRVAFLNSKPGQAHAAFVLQDNALMRFDEIQALVDKGYLVRTRTDIETYEAKVNDFTRAEAAFSSGAQIISTDFPYLENTWGTEYRVTLPGGFSARCNPVNGGCE